MSMLRFKGDLNKHAMCVTCDQLMRGRIEKQCKLWRQIMHDPTSVTGATIRAHAAMVYRLTNYAEMLKKEYNYRSYILNTQIRTYRGERASPFDPRCVGAHSLHLRK